MAEGDGPWELPYDPEFETEVLRALGEMVVQAGMLEQALGDLHWLVSGKSWDAARDDLRDKTLGQISGVAIAGFEKRFPSGDLRERFDRVKPELRKAIDTRNEFVHASWAFDHAKRRMRRRRLPRGAPSVREYRYFSAADVAAASKLVGVCARRLWEEVYDPAVRARRSQR